MKATLWIANRLRLAGSAGYKNPTGALIAVIGVALAIVVMEITLCVVSGFKTEIQNKIIGFDAQISVGRPYDYETGLQDDFISLDNNLLSVVNRLDNVNITPSLTITLPGMLKTEDDFSGALFIAHDATHDNSFEKKNIVDGIFPDYSIPENDNNIVISRLIADNLKLKTGDNIFVYFFTDSSLKSRKVLISGIYDSNMAEYDKTVCYSSLAFLQKVIGVDGQTGTHIEFSGLDVENINEVGQNLQNLLSFAAQGGELEKLYPVTTVLQTGAIYFNWLSLLDTNVVVIFILMMAVALFTLVSSLFLIILDRIPTIGIFKSLGTSNKMLSDIFLSMGMRLTVYGLLIGNTVGLTICGIQYYTGIIKLNPQMYYLSEVPIEFQIIPLILLNVSVLIISALMLYVPSKSVSRIDPTQSMRYE